MINSMKLNIKEGVTTVEYEEPVIGKVKKNISTENLCEILASCSKNFDLVIPPGCRHIIKNKTTSMFTFVSPAFKGLHKVKYYDSWERATGYKKPVKGKLDADNNITYELPYPNGLSIILMLETGKGYEFKSIYHFALDSFPFTLENLQLYYWPFSNMYTDGKVCIGNIPRTYTSIEQLQAIPKYIYTGIGNCDLISTPVATVDAPREFKNAMTIPEAIADMNEYPINRLKPILKYEDVLNNILPRM